jgi:hypothetical protein
MATTTNYGWTTPDDTDLVKDGAAAIRTLGSSIDTTTKNLNPETTTGDIAYRSATANTNTRLALGTAGQVLTVNSGATAPEWAAAAGGLTLVKSQAFTSLSSQSVSSAFSSTYKRYKVVLEINSLSTTGSIFMRLRSGANDNTSNNYSFSEIFNTSSASTPSGLATNLTDKFGVAYLNSAGADLVVNMEMNNPFATNFTTYTCANTRNEGSGLGVMSVGGGTMSVTTSYDAFTIFPQSGTFTGKATVYGYQD